MQGDSGGPLVYDNHVVGIASYTIDILPHDCASGYPDIFTRVAATDWIKANDK